MQKEQQFQVADLSLENPLNVTPVYANAANVVSTQWDVRVIFSEIVVMGSKARMELRANVVMTPDHFRALTKVFNENLAKLNDVAKAKE